MNRAIATLLIGFAMGMFAAPGFVWPAIAAPNDNASPDTSSVGPGSLDADLFDGLPARPAKPLKPSSAPDTKPPPATITPSKPNTKNSNSETEPPVIDGEDVGPKSAVDALKMIAERMDLAARQLGDQANVTPDTLQLQEQVSLDLARLVLAIQRQMKQNPSQQAGTAPSGTKPTTQPSSTELKPRDPGEGQSAESVETSGKPRKIGSDGPTVSRAMQSAWDQLPPRLRASLPSLAPEAFLPGYRKLIEDYYLRLAEPGVD